MVFQSFIRRAPKSGSESLAKAASKIPQTAVFQQRSQSNSSRFRQQEQRYEEAKAIERNFTRDWKPGDVYAPHDLSAAEARKWRKKKAPTTDAFDILSLNPLDLYKNFSVMSEYVTDMGRIKPRSQTGLRPVNQRRLSKAIRRAIALGLMPSVHRHPEILRLEKKQAKGQSDEYW